MQDTFHREFSSCAVLAKIVLVTDADGRTLAHETADTMPVPTLLFDRKSTLSRSHQTVGLPQTQPHANEIGVFVSNSKARQRNSCPN